MINPKLLISVRNVEEAEIALASGASLIDVKEPANGSLGRASLSVIREVAERIGDRCTVSAAMGELVDDLQPVPNPVKVSYLKWGLSRCCEGVDWRSLLQRKLGVTASVVTVAYADAEIARSPDVNELVDEVCRHPGRTLLIDTFDKSAMPKRRTLLNWLSVSSLREICRRCQAHASDVALAGSLGRAEIETLLSADVRPNWLGVRGAICAEGSRTTAVCSRRARELVLLLGDD